MKHILKHKGGDGRRKSKRLSGETQQQGTTDALDSRRCYGSSVKHILKHKGGDGRQKSKRLSGEMQQQGTTDALDAR